MAAKKSIPPLNLPYPHSEYQGVPIPVFIPKERMEEVKNSHKTRPDDVYIATFPKSGTTWLQKLLNEILGKPQGESDQISTSVPWCEGSPQEMVDNMKSPRAFKTHDPYDWIPKGEGVKYVYCYRNPKDMAVSYYHHIKMMNLAYGYEGTFDDFMDDIFLPGNNEFGNYFTHAEGWLKQKDNPNVLTLTFEDMVEDLKREVVRIVKFLGLDLSDEKINEIAFGGSFNEMKKEGKCDYRWMEGIVMNGKSNFMRKGKVGDYVNYMNDEHSKLIDGLVAKHLTPLGAKIRYEL